MGNTSGAKYKHMMYNVSRVRQKSGKKLQKAINRYIDLVKKERHRGTTKWIIKTREKALARIKKMGITQKMLDEALTKRGLA